MMGYHETDNDLDTASTGEVFVRDGVRWEVYGFYDEPVVLLRRAADDPLMPINDRTHMAVVPWSDFGGEWKREA